MEKQIKSMNFSKNVDNQPLLEESVAQNKNDSKDSNKIVEKFKDQLDWQYICKYQDKSKSTYAVTGAFFFTLFSFTK